MRIGILTFHNAHNYGAVLQAYALRTFLRNKNYDVNIINYKNSTISSRYIKKLSMNNSLRNVRNKSDFRRYILELCEIRKKRTHWIAQCKKFEDFINNVLLENNTVVVAYDKLSELSVDCFIAGSDQIWNKYLTDGLDRAYLLDFDTKAIKVFYGASNGDSVVEDCDKEYFSQIISKSNFVSTREKGLAVNLNNLTEKEVCSVVDPTLLLSAKDYLSLIRNVEPAKTCVFAYFISEDDTMLNIARLIANALSLPLIELHYYKTRNLRDENQRADLGPIDFINYINSAKFVVTNSFHGTVFSILFHKSFYSVYDKDKRKDNLLENLGIYNRHIYNIKDVDLNKRIDYIDVDQKLQGLRKKSELFLNQALQG